MIRSDSCSRIGACRTCRADNDPCEMLKSFSGTAAAADRDLKAAVEELRALGIRALARMYRPAERLFAFRLRRHGAEDILEGISRRYTGIVLIALAGESERVAGAILGNQKLAEVCQQLIDDAERTADLGEAALTLWAARACGHAETGRALERLRNLRPDTATYPTVEVAWSLSALAAGYDAPTDRSLAERIADRLMRSFCQGSGLFPHTPAGVPASRLRGHVCCYADLVYPIQALSFWYRLTGSLEARDIAGRCAERMCALQGQAGQWWWHYDIRTGQVLERYPVYAIHQDAMGPMALFDLAECCGIDHGVHVERSMQWLFDPPEIRGSLIDHEADVIWRKVARYEPGKLVRNLQAGLSRLNPGLRLPGEDLLFPVGYVDYETRPYHMGWMLYAWSPARVARLWGERGTYV